jgi:hypothetical protein
LDTSVEAAGQGSFDGSPDVAVGFTFGAAADLVVDGFGVASEPGDGDGVQGTVEISVAAPVAPVPGALPAAGFEGSGSG